jgi:hypothetical protein
VTGIASHGVAAVTFMTSPTVTGAPTAGGCTETLTAGTETCTIHLTISTSGTYTVAASYAGDGLDAASDGSTQLIVAGAITSTSVSCSPSTIYADQTSTCSATVSGIVGTATPPAVGFTANGTGWTFTNEACTDSSGSETCTATFAPGSAGMAQLNAGFAGDASNLGSASKFGLTVESTVVLSCSGTDAWICTAAVTDHRNLPSTPTGMIALTGGVTGGSSSSLGSCTLQSTINPAVSDCTIDVNPHASSAQWTLTASYSGDGVHRTGSDTITYKDPA